MQGTLWEANKPTASPQVQKLIENDALSNYAFYFSHCDYHLNATENVGAKSTVRKEPQIVRGILLFLLNAGVALKHEGAADWTFWGYLPFARHAY